jgi:hypothetical protein
MTEPTAEEISRVMRKLGSAKSERKAAAVRKTAARADAPRKKPNGQQTPRTEGNRGSRLPEMRSKARRKLPHEFQVNRRQTAPSGPH